MHTTPININLINRTNININSSNLINFKGNIKPKKNDADISKCSFLIKKGQKRAKKIEKSLPYLQKQADKVSKMVKNLNFPLDGSYDGHPDVTYQRAITALSNDLMQEVTGRGEQPAWDIQYDIVMNERCVGNNGENNLDTREKFLTEYLSDSEEFYTMRDYADCDNPHEMTAGYTKDNLIVEKKSLSGDEEEFLFSKKGKLLRYTQKTPHQVRSKKMVPSIKYIYNEKTGEEIFAKKGNRYNDSVQYIFRNGQLVMEKRYNASSNSWDSTTKPAKIAIEFKKGKIKNIFENYSEQNRNQNFTAKHSVTKNNELECIFNLLAFNPSASITVSKN